MANLTLVEKRFFEEIFDMSGGYVLDFTNSTFAEFFRDTVGIDIYDGKYAYIGNSKAKRLRAFWEKESDKVVGKVLKELLEIWKYNQEKQGKKTEAGYERGLKIANRLLGKKNNDILSEGEFLKEDNIDILHLNLETDLFEIIEQRISEIKNCLQHNAPLAAIFLCGSILEALLLNFATKYPQKFNTASSAPKTKDGKVKKFREWTLKNFIDVAYEINFINLDVKKYSHVLRDFRNYIHPYQQMISKFRPDGHTAKISWQVLKAAISDLSKIKENKS